MYLIDTLEKQMADLDKSVADLEAAVDSINVRFATELQTLQTALDEANQALADEELDDAAKDAAAPGGTGSGRLCRPADPLPGRRAQRHRCRPEHPGRRGCRTRTNAPR